MKSQIAVENYLQTKDEMHLNGQNNHFYNKID